LQLTAQATPLFAASFPTVAVTCTLTLGSRVVGLGVLTDTQIGSETFTFVVPEIAGLLTAAAVIVTANPGVLLAAGAL
jgi:hypothetical protein